MIIAIHILNIFLFASFTHSGGTGRFYVDPTSQTITTLVLNHIDEESLGMYTCNAGPLTTTYNVTIGKLEFHGVGLFWSDTVYSIQSEVTALPGWETSRRREPFGSQKLWNGPWFHHNLYKSGATFVLELAPGSCTQKIRNSLNLIRG